MDVLSLNARAQAGGAAQAAFRLHRGLRRTGVNSRMLVQRKDVADRPDVSSIYDDSWLPSTLCHDLRAKLDGLPLRRYPNRRDTFFSVNWIPDRIETVVEQCDPDVVQLHWINEGFLQVDTLASIDRPIVWTLHDMWPFTGGCHYSGDCTRYRQQCGRCPELGSDTPGDLTRRLWERKSEHWSDIDLTVVTPSEWLGDCARSSSLFDDVKVRTIPNGIDTAEFTPELRSAGRDLFEFPEDKAIVLFGADEHSNHRKGYDLLLKAFAQLRHSVDPEDVVLVTFGSQGDTTDEGLAFESRNLGYVDPESLQVLYATADVTVVPSRQDNLPNIVLESLASGTPCVGFDVGGLPDMIDHRENGYLAEPFEPSSLADGIEFVVEDALRLDRLSTAAREAVLERFDLETIAGRYRALYESRL